MSFAKTLCNSLLLGLILSASNADAQQIRYDRVDFIENPSWTDVLDRASSTDKIIFLDGYTTWCAPCKKMEKEVFTRPEIANFFNQKFINVKYDMELAQGSELKERYGVQAFPTYIFITPTGQEIHRIVGAHTAGNDFFDWSKMAVTPGRSRAELEQRYKNGERSPAMMFDYMLTLRMAGEQKKEAEITRNYLALMTKDHFMDKTYWAAVKLFLNDPTSREFRIILENRDEIGAAIGLDDVDAKIYETFDQQIKSNISFQSYEGHLFDKQAELDLIGLLQQSNTPNRNELLARARAAHHIRNGDLYELAYMVDAIIEFRMLENYKNLRTDLDYYANSIAKLALDDLLFKKALKWAEFAATNEPNSAERANYLKTKAILLEKLGRNTEAAATKKEAEKVEKM
ncbi:MAG: thioredoxin fold domain-containing protein [Saprospiraceae bacterium]|nr:thioredoxin fold domain-containing protein [Saprospiraceae bacterium]